MVVKAGRSLKASSIGIRRANRAVMVFATKIDLAAELEISRATVQNFFAGKPIGRENFHKICQTLKLPWHEIADLTDEMDIEPAEGEPVLEDDRDSAATIACANRAAFNVAPLPSPQLDLVQTLRQQMHISIQQQCGSLRVLDMSQPRKLGDIYTEVNLLEKINSRRRLNISDLLKASGMTEGDRPCLNNSAQTPLSGLDAVQQHSKLMILGKPGAGKTTFLKQIAIQCINGSFLADRAPIFISLKDFSNAPRVTLLQYITNQFAAVSEIAAQLVPDILAQGKALLLLDGLDEVTWSDRQHVLHAVRQFLAQFHANQFVITCRIAAQEYVFEQFTEVEIADFDRFKITSFALKWFAARDASLSFRFIHALDQNQPIQELATSPILLTLLCLVFEDSGEFPASRAALYKEALQVMLKTWDARRNIERSQAHNDLSLHHKEELLSQIALFTFERGDYFFRQNELEEFICDYRRRLSHTCAEPNDRMDNEAVLKSIEAQHGLLVERARGIYSFPHFVFHEYFAAQRLVTVINDSTSDKLLQRLMTYATNRRWREVFLLTAEMLPSTDRLIQRLKQKIDDLAEEANLQRFLNWLAQKTETISTAGNVAELRTLYLELELGWVLDLTNAPRSLSGRHLNGSLDGDLQLDWLLARVLALPQTIDRALEEAPEPFVLTLVRSMVQTLVQAINGSWNVAPDLAPALQYLNAQLPELPEASIAPKAQFRDWWQQNSSAWTTQLRTVIIQHRNLGHDWRFTAQQKLLLKQYYRANQLLLDCLNHACSVSETTLPKSQSMLLSTADYER